MMYSVLVVSYEEETESYPNNYCHATQVVQLGPFSTRAAAVQVRDDLNRDYDNVDARVLEHGQDKPTA